MSLTLRCLRSISLSSALLLLSGCGMLDWFKKDDEALEPMPLVDFREEVRLRREWSVNVGNGQGDKYNRLVPAMQGGRIYAAANNGQVVAVNRETGRTEWRERLDYDITGGVGVGGGLVIVGTEKGRVIALDADSGDVRWESTVTSEVLAPPATDGRVVVVQTVDGNLVGLDAQNGAERWIYENQVPALSLRGTSAPLIIQNFAVAALANGSVVSVALDNGTLRWEERVAIPTGRSEIDRMVDIDGYLSVFENQVLAPSYQGYFSAIDPVTGQTRWRVQESTSQGASFGFGNVYVVSEGDIVKAYRLGQESAGWTNDQMQRRRLSAPLGFSNYVAVGDSEGYVHLLSQSDGRFMSRAKVDGKGVRANMLAQGNILYVYGNGGTLAAYRVE